MQGTRQYRLASEDHASHDVLELSPPGRAIGVAICGHSMMTDRRTLYRPDRPGLAAALRERGFIVLLPDLRGHGASGPGAAEGGSWGYDDLVADMGLYLRHARDVGAGLPIVLVGHSLSGGLALAHLGRTADPGVAGVVTLASYVQNPRFAPRWRGAGYRLSVRAFHLIARLFGRLPVRRFGAGSSDEPVAFWRDLTRMVTSGRYAARDGFDYHEGFRRVACRVLHIVSAADRWYAPPSDAAAFIAPLPRCRLIVAGDPAAPPPYDRLAPSHMGFVLDRRSQPIWEDVAAWALAAAGGHLADPSRREAGAARDAS